MKAAIKEQARGIVRPLAQLLGGLGVSPDHLTWAGLVASAAAGIWVANGRFRIAALVLTLGGLCDMLDGAVARETGRVSRFGAFFDSTIDRVAEILFFAGLLVYFTRIEYSVLYATLAFLAAGGSLMVSYARARAEGLGLDCSVGIMERPERLLLLVVATLLGATGVRIALWLLTVLTFWTAAQRVIHVRRLTREE